MNPNLALPPQSRQLDAEKVTPLSVKLAQTSRQRLGQMAQIQRRPAHTLAREAIEEYLTREEEKIRQNQEADASWRHYQDTGLHVTGEEAMAWIQSWGKADELP